MSASFIVITFVIVISMFIWALFTPAVCKKCGRRTEQLHRCPICEEYICEYCLDDSGWCKSCTAESLKGLDDLKDLDDVRIVSQYRASIIVQDLMRLNRNED